MFVLKALKYLIYIFLACNLKSLTESLNKSIEKNENPISPSFHKLSKELFLKNQDWQPTKPTDDAFLPSICILPPINFIQKLKMCPGKYLYLHPGGPDLFQSTIFNSMKNL